jgi:putative transposase
MSGTPGEINWWLRHLVVASLLHLSADFAGQTVGVREVEDQIWQVSFLEYDLGYFDNERGRVEPGPNPFVPDKVLTMCPE